MARSFRKRRKTNAKGQSFYQIFGPNPKTGKDEYRETVKGHNAGKRANDRLRELTAEAHKLTDTGKKETRKVSDLVEAFLDHVDERHRWTKQSKQWFAKGRSLRSDTRRGYHDRCRRFILPELGDIILISLELKDLQRMVNWVEDEISGPQARAAGQTIKTIINWGDEHGYAMQPLLHRLLRKAKLLLPEKVRREYDMPLVNSLLQRCLVVVFGPRTGKTTRRGYLYRRMIWGLGLGCGLRREEMASIKMAEIDWRAGTAEVYDGIDRLTGEILEGGTKSLAGHRTIWLPRCVLEAAAYKERLWPGEELLFEADRGGENIYKGMLGSYVLKVCKEAGLTKDEIKSIKGVHLHLLRHVFASNADGAPRADLKRAMGHSRIEGGDQTTSGYIHTTTNGTISFGLAQGALDLLMPATITPLDEALTLARTGYQRLTAGERRLYIQEYRKKHPRKRRLALAAPAGNTRANQD
jgi:integrase